jgi:hypothetical protein
MDSRFFQKTTEDSIVLNAGTTEETIARADVKRVRLKKAGLRGRNRVIAGVGLAAGPGAKLKGWFPNAGKAC